MFAASLSVARVALSATYSVSDGTASPTNASARFRLASSGDIYRILVNGGTTDIGDWIAPKSAAGGNYECMATVVSGSLSTGTAGSWLALSSDQEWGRNQTTLGTSVCVITVDIRRVGTTTTLASTTVTLTADKSS